MPTKTEGEPGRIGFEDQASWTQVPGRTVILALGP